MLKMRFALIGCSILFWVAIGMIIKLSQEQSHYAAPVLIGSMIGGAIFSYKFSKKMKHNHVVWSILGFLMPGIVPLTLGVTGRKAKIPVENKIKLDGTVLQYKKGWFTTKQVDLAQLRLATLILPFNSKYRVIFSSNELLVRHLDMLDEDEYTSIIGLLETMLREVEPNELFVFEDIKLCLVEYEGRELVLSLRDFRVNSFPIFQELARHQNERRKRLRVWLDNDGTSSLAKARFDEKGFHKKNKSISWDQVALAQISKQNIGPTSLLIIPEGVKSGFLGVKKFGYSIRIKKAQEYRALAEAYFWLTEMAQLRASEVSRSGETLLNSNK
jgi:hypothetical protein